MYKESLHSRVIVSEIAAFNREPKGVKARLELDVNFLAVLAILFAFWLVVL